MTTLTITGMKELQDKLGNLEASKLLKPLLTMAASDVKSKLATYPPSGDANIPYQRRWYERGWGSKWMRADGSVGGNKTSEMLGRSWTTEVNETGTRASVGTKVTYAQYVQDADFQAYYHGARGWKTVQDIAEDYGPELVSAIEAEITRLLGS